MPVPRGAGRLHVGQAFLPAFAQTGARMPTIAAKPYDYWLKHLQTMEGQWAPIQGPLEIAADPQMEANGYILPVTDAEGNERKLVASPVQFDETPPVLTRAPLFAEQTDELLRELGRSEDEIIQLKIDGAVT